MQEEKLNILNHKSMRRFDCICFTSNGIIKTDGSLVMGKGVAYAFKIRFPAIQLLAGKAVKQNGNICQVIDHHINTDGYECAKRKLEERGILFHSLTPSACAVVVDIVAFPTKHNWRDKSDFGLIIKSAGELMDLADKHEWKEVALPRPGCLNGQLSWEGEVKPALDKILDDRIIITTL